jgi:hypothetical protein
MNSGVLTLGVIFLILGILFTGFSIAGNDERFSIGIDHPVGDNLGWILIGLGIMLVIVGALMPRFVKETYVDDRGPTTRTHGKVRSRHSRSTVTRQEID